MNATLTVTAPEGAEPVARSRAQRGAAAGAALPCRNINNCTKSVRYRLTLRRSFEHSNGTKITFGQPEKTDQNGRVWRENESGVLENLWGQASPAERKLAFQLRRNVEAFVEHWGRPHCAFFTLTDTEGLSPKEFGRRWHSFATHEGGWILGYVRVLEPQRNKRPHYHFLIATRWNMEPDKFDWESFFLAQEQAPRHGQAPGPQFAEARRRYRDSAPIEVREMWKRLRNTLPKYGLGRSEFLPVRKGKEALCEYVGKYLEAGLVFRVHGWKGARRVECDRRTSDLWKRCGRMFSWISPGAKLWRKRVAYLAKAFGVRENDFEDMKQTLGERWAYRLREKIIGSDETEWPEVVALLVEAYDRQALWG